MLKPIALSASIVLAALLPSGSASAVSEDVRMACLFEAYQVRPMLNAPRIEAYVANCIADATARKPRKQRKRPN
jgi:hypothetical protein